MAYRHCFPDDCADETARKNPNGTIMRRMVTNTQIYIHDKIQNVVKDDGFDYPFPIKTFCSETCTKPNVKCEGDECGLKSESRDPKRPIEPRNREGHTCLKSGDSFIGN